MSDKTLVEIYKESQHQLEQIQSWRGAMMDKIRAEAANRMSGIREGYMIEDMEAHFRGVAKSLVILDEHGSIELQEIKEYILTPTGMTVVYNDYVPCEYFGAEQFENEVDLTWEDLQNAIDKTERAKLRTEERLQQS